MNPANETKSLIASFFSKNLNGYDTLESTHITPSESSNFASQQYVYEEGPEFSKMPGKKLLIYILSILMVPIKIIDLFNSK